MNAETTASAKKIMVMRTIGKSVKFFDTYKESYAKEPHWRAGVARYESGNSGSRSNKSTKCVKTATFFQANRR
jgi:hypothetical protein